MIRQSIARSGEIPKHRIGTDLFLKVYVTRICGEPEDFANASDLKVTLWHMFHPWKKEENFTVGGGEISLQLSADDQWNTGVYGVTVSYSKADDQSETGVRKFAVDIPYAFELVAISQTCDCVGRVDLCGHVQIAADGINGLTPYIGDNGNWWIGGYDTGKPSAPKGKRSWQNDVTYEMLDMVYHEGKLYLSLHGNNVGNDPASDSEEAHWMMLAERGESWYQMCVRTGRFEGTEEEFLDEKQKQIDNATAAAKLANDASEEALRQASNAKEQADQAKETITEVEASIEKANEAADNANDTANHPTYIGADFYVYVWDKGTSSYTKTSIFTRGKNFSVYKTYESVEAMQADLSSVPEGEFVLISNEDMEDVDNAKLYVRTSSGFNFLVDMSGAMGFAGKTPQISVGSVTVGSSLTDISVSLSPNGTDADGNPCFLLNVKVPALHWTDLTEEQKDELRAPLAEEIDILITKETRNAKDIEWMIKYKDHLGDVTAISLDTEKWPTITGLPIMRIGSGTPSMIPDFIGQRYVDTTNKKLYFAFGVNSISDWGVLN